MSEKCLTCSTTCFITTTWIETPRLIIVRRDPVIGNEEENQTTIFQEEINIKLKKFSLFAVGYYHSNHFYCEVKNPFTNTQLNGWYSHDGLKNNGKLSQISHPFQEPTRVSYLFYASIE